MTGIMKTLFIAGLVILVLLLAFLLRPHSEVDPHAAQEIEKAKQR
jgi:hypothetical protein